MPKVIPKPQKVKIPLLFGVPLPEILEGLAEKIEAESDRRATAKTNKIARDLRNIARANGVRLPIVAIIALLIENETDDGSDQWFTGPGDIKGLPALMKTECDKLITEIVCVFDQPKQTTNSERTK